MMQNTQMVLFLVCAVVFATLAGGIALAMGFEAGTALLASVSVGLALAVPASGFWARAHTAPGNPA